MMTKSTLTREVISFKKERRKEVTRQKKNKKRSCKRSSEI